MTATRIRPDTILKFRSIKMAVPSASRIYNGSTKIGQKTTVTRVRVFQEDNEQLLQLYPGNISVLVRLLLRKFLHGELPEVKREFEEKIKAPVL
jgi:hypothetical protein